jgi:hypothetical protein
MSAKPPVIGDSVGESRPGGFFGRTTDTAKYVVDPSRFERPRLSIVNGDEFEWPVGTEGVRIHGSASLAMHKYLGDNAVVVQVTHRDERHLEMSGEFPGITGAKNMRDLLEIIQADTPDDGKILTLPGVFPKQQFVVIEDYDFSHDKDDRLDSWNYTVNFVKSGVGKKIVRGKVVASPVNPITSKKGNRGTSGRVFTTRAGASTLRQVAQNVYSNSNRWRDIYDLNTAKLDALGIPTYLLPTKPLPLGMKLGY